MCPPQSTIWAFTIKITGILGEWRERECVCVCRKLSNWCYGVLTLLESTTTQGLHIPVHMRTHKRWNTHFYHGKGEWEDGRRYLYFSLYCNTGLSIQPSGDGVGLPVFALVFGAFYERLETDRLYIKLMRKKYTANNRQRQQKIIRNRDQIFELDGTTEWGVHSVCAVDVPYGW